jgi:hypothetical protein
MEMNSHLAALHISTWETLSDFLSKAIQLKPTETSHALTQSLHALTLHRPQQTQIIDHSRLKTIGKRFKDSVTNVVHMTT